ncbi:RNA polymerase sigma factor [Candidatus Dependentiae bacterium]|nr:RNA polymerase sigma factor [Candidatus Dependentiae bacterium]
MDYTKLTNEELVKKIQDSGCVNCQNALFERLFDYSGYYIQNKYYNINESERDDIISETIARFFNTLDRFDHMKSKVLTYFTTIMRNKCNDYFKKHKLVKTESLDALISESSDDSFINFAQADDFNFDAHTASSEIFNSVLNSLRRLQNYDYKIALFLRLNVGLDNREIAELTGRSENTVKSDVSRGIKEIILMLEEYWGELDNELLAFFNHNISGLKLNQKDINKISDTLTRQILEKRFLENYEYRAIAKKFNLNEQQVFEKIIEGINYIIDKGMTRKNKITIESLDADSIDRILNYITPLNKMLFRLPKNRNTQNNINEEIIYLIALCINRFDMPETTAEYSDFGIFIGSMIEYNNYSFDEFADKLQISKLELTSYMNNLKFPDEKIKTKIAKLFNIKVSELNLIIEHTSAKLAMIAKMKKTSRADINHNKFKNELRKKVIRNE